jgi:anti-anti-sigma factor
MRELAHVTIRSEGDERWLGVAGELEIDSVAVLQSAVADALETGSGDVVIDVAPTTFIDSTGLAGLLAASREVALHDRRMRVHAPLGHEARVLIELSGTGRALGLFP